MPESLAATGAQEGASANSRQSNMGTGLPGRSKIMRSSICPWYKTTDMLRVEYRLQSNDRTRLA
jgi:hypothetical protein